MYPIHITILSILIIGVVAVLFWRLSNKMTALKALDTQQKLAAFFVMREYAYCDASLEKLLEIMGNLESPEKETIVAIMAGDLADAKKKLASIPGEPDVLYRLSQARIKQIEGDIEGAKNEAVNILHPDEESRAKISAWAVLRELGQMPTPEEADEVLGVVCEFTLDKNSVLISGYSDGDARLLTSSGFGMIGVMQQHPGIRDAAIALVNAAKPLVKDIPKSDSRPLPEPGRFRLSLLTPGGMRGVDEDQMQVATKGHRFFIIFSAMQDLLTNFRLTSQNIKIEQDSDNS